MHSDETSRHSYFGYQPSATTPTPAYPVAPPPQYAPPQGPKSKRSRTVALVVVAGVVLIGLGIGGAFAYAKTGRQSTAVRKAGTSPQVTAPAVAAPPADCQYGSFGNGSCLPSPAARVGGTVQDMFVAAVREHAPSSAGVDDNTLITLGATMCASLDIFNGDVSKAITDGGIPKNEQVAIARDAGEYLCPQWRDRTRAYKP